MSAISLKASAVDLQLESLFVLIFFDSSNMVRGYVLFYGQVKYQQTKQLQRNS